MRRRTALVLSGGGMFGAWQAGAWQALAATFQPDLIVGASVGSLNGYAIAGGATPEELREMWTRSRIGQMDQLPNIIRDLMERFPLRIDYAVVLTEALRLKPRIFRGSEITWRHLAASCAIPGFLPLQRIEGRLYGDGGLLNPLPVWAAVELGATRIVALNVLAEVPSSVLKPFVKGFRLIAGYRPPVPSGVEVTIIKPEGSLGSAMEAIRWNRANIDRWLERGRTETLAARQQPPQSDGNISIENCLER